MSQQAKVLYQQDLNNISAYIIIKPQQQSYCTIKPKPVAWASQRLWEILRPREALRRQVRGNWESSMILI